MALTEQDLEDATLEVTSGPEWDIVKKGLANEIYQQQAQALDAKDWGEVCRLRGFAQGIAHMMSMRERTIIEKNNRAAV